MMVLKRRNLGVVPQLPNEILEEIFVRLHAKTLVKLTAVCKLWKSLIKTSAFIHAYLNRSRNQHQILLIQALAAVKIRGKEEARYLFYLHWDKPPFNVYSNYKHITHPFVAYNRLHATSPKDKIEISQVRVIGTCNGLVCLVAGYGYTALVWNPCIRKFLTLPRLIFNIMRYREISNISYGFGYDSRTNDYKVVRIVRYGAETARKPSYDIWSLAQPSWRGLSALPTVDNFYPSPDTIFVRGAVHWVHGISVQHRKYYYSIVSFDMSSEVFGEIMIPEVMMERRNVIISRYRNSLAILQWDYVLDGESKQLDMWVMKEYGVVESWTKLLTVELPAKWIKRLGFRNSGEAVIDYFTTTAWKRKSSPHVPILLNPDTGDISDLRTNGGRFRDYQFVEPFVESLILLDQPSAIST